MSLLDTKEYESTDLSGFYSWTEQLKGVQYGPGCVETALPKFLTLFGAKKALIVTGRSLYEKVGAIHVRLLSHTDAITSRARRLRS